MPQCRLAGLGQRKRAAEFDPPRRPDRDRTQREQDLDHLAPLREPRAVEPGTERRDPLLAFRGDLERIAAWAGLVGVNEGLWPRGQGVGRIQLASDADRATANLTLTAEPFTLVRATAGAPPTPAWQEPNLQLATELAYTSADDRLQLTNLRLDGQTIKLTGGGAIPLLGVQAGSLSA